MLHRLLQNLFFTSVVRHGYMPHCLRDCVLTPIPKSGKDISSSQNYRAIALASSLSKVLEHLILKKYSSFLSTSHLQFGFKSGFSTTLCTGVLFHVISTVALQCWGVFWMPVKLLV